MNIALLITQHICFGCSKDSCYAGVVFFDNLQHMFWFTTEKIIFNDLLLSGRLNGTSVVKIFSLCLYVLLDSNWRLRFPQKS